MVWPWLSLSSSVDTHLLLPSLYFFALVAVSDIYCHEDVLDFTNLFLDFDQGYQTPRRVLTIPVSPKTILPEVLLTHRGYPRGESQGDSSGVSSFTLLLMGCTDWTLGGIPGFFNFDKAELVSSKPLHQKGNHHHPSDEEHDAWDKRSFVYHYNQGGEKNQRDNQTRPYPSLTNICCWLETSKYRHDQFRELGLGDLVMVGKEWWRKHVRTLDIEGFPEAWLLRGLREIHHAGDHMDGRMDTCLGYTAVLGAEIYESIGELWDELREDQKKRSLDGWERMDMKRQLEDALCDAEGEVADLKARVDALESLVDKLTCLTPLVPQEATFCPASPPLPDIGYPPAEIPGLTANQAAVDDFLDWLSFDRSWPHGGYEADVVRTDLANRPTEPMLVSLRARYTKLWGNR